MQTICSYLEEESSPKVKLKRPVVPMEEEKEKKEEEESSPKVKLKRPVGPMEEEKEKKKEEEEQEKEEQQKEPQKEPEEEEDKEEELEVASRTGRLQQLLNSSVKVSVL